MEAKRLYIDGKADSCWCARCALISAMLLDWVAASHWRTVQANGEYLDNSQFTSPSRPMTQALYLGIGGQAIPSLIPMKAILVERVIDRSPSGRGIDGDGRQGSRDGKGKISESIPIWHSQGLSSCHVRVSFWWRIVLSDALGMSPYDLLRR
jgi:hypothetical protein